MTIETFPIGEHLREWRHRRRFSQLDLALEAEISARHLSFLETGRSLPSREMLLRLAERLGIPLRERNRLLVAAGYAPVFSERSLDDPALAAARRAVDLILSGHEPYPAIAIDRHWQLVAANGAIGPLLTGVAPELLVPPVNVLRLGLHPQGLAQRTANFAEWRAHLLDGLRRQIDLTADPVLSALLNELEAYPRPRPEMAPRHKPAGGADSIAMPFKLVTEAGILSFYSTTTVFGTPVDVTLSELALETFFPADAATAAALSLAAESKSSRK